MFSRERRAVRVNGDGARTDCSEMCERRLSLGVNISILVILTIFGVLLSLPLRLLFYTNYYTQEQTVYGSETSQLEECTTMPEIIVIPVDHRKLRRCPKFLYEEQMKSVFHSYYDRNCTYVRVYAIDADPPEEKELEVKEERVSPEKETAEESQESKDIVVAGHILVTMLLASAITALVEVLRIRFAKDKVQDHRRLSAAPRSRYSKLSQTPRQSEVHQLIGCPGVSRSDRKRKSGGLLHMFIIARV